MFCMILCKMVYETIAIDQIRKINKESKSVGATQEITNWWDLRYLLRDYNVNNTSTTYSLKKKRTHI